MQPGMLGRLAADQRAARLAAASRDRADELRDAGRVEPADRHVVEEEERRGPAADDIVGAHRDEVAADRVVAAERRRDRRLRADAVGRADQERRRGSPAGRATAPAKPPSPPITPGRWVDSTAARIRARRPARRRPTSTPARA